MVEQRERERERSQICNSISIKKSLHQNHFHTQFRYTVSNQKYARNLLLLFTKKSNCSELNTLESQREGEREEERMVSKSMWFLCDGRLPTFCKHHYATRKKTSAALHCSFAKLCSLRFQWKFRRRIATNSISVHRARFTRRFPKNFETIR